MGEWKSEYRFEYPKNRMFKWLSILFIVWFFLDLKLNMIEDNIERFFGRLSVFLILFLYLLTLGGEAILSSEGIRITGLSFTSLFLKNKVVPFSKIKSIEHFTADEVSLLGKKMKLKDSEKINEVRIRVSKDYPLFKPFPNCPLANVIVLPILNPEEFVDEVKKHLNFS